MLHAHGKKAIAGTDRCYFSCLVFSGVNRPLLAAINRRIIGSEHHFSIPNGPNNGCWKGVTDCMKEVGLSYVACVGVTEAAGLDVRSMRDRTCGW